MQQVALIGFGEAGRAFAGSDGWTSPTRVYDRRDDADIRAAFAATGITACAASAEAVKGAELVISLVTADQAFAVATAVAAELAPGALFLDCNSVAPETKRAAARVIEGAGGRYVDVAVMAPVLPARLNAPLLVGGQHAGAAMTALPSLGFTTVRVVGDEVGCASAIKMIRSVMVKGLEALTAECFLAAEAAGVRDEVTTSLNTSWPAVDWAKEADYNLDRMMVHGLRRADEMVQAVHTLEALGTGAALSRGTVRRQRAIGRLAATPPEGLAAKLNLLLHQRGGFEEAA